MAEAKIASIAPKTIDKNGVECRIIFTEDYIKPNANGVDVFYKGVCIYTNAKNCFKHFKEGNLVHVPER